MSLLRTPMRIAAAVMAAGALAGGALAVSSTPAFATNNTLGSVGFSVSNNAASLGGVDNTATYSWNFVTAQEGTLTQLTFTVPAGVTGSPLSINGSAYGLTGCTPTPSVASGTVTVTLTNCSDIAAGTPVYISISGFTNSSSIGDVGSFSSTVTTYTGAGPTELDTGTSNSVSFANNTTGVTVVVPDSLTFTNGNTSVSLLPVPGTVATSSPVPLTVSTNAKGGYTLSGCVLPANVITGPDSATIGQAGNDSAAPLPTDGNSSAFGAQATETSGSATLQTAWHGTGSDNYLGYAAACGTTGGEQISSNTGPTTGDVLTLTNGVGISNTQTAGTYTGTVSYQVTPSY